MKSKKNILSLILISFILLTNINVASAESNYVSVTVPKFKVSINGQIMDNEYNMYPLLVYKGITYFPMTYHLCRFLGVETNWDNATRTLSINKSGINTAYVADTKGKNKKGAIVNVSIVNYPVVVNGVTVNNSSTKWPLINYNDITYFPLTWQFAVESFGWEYNWDATNGLRIKSSAKLEETQKINTGDAELDVALTMLSKLYIEGGKYSGTLIGPDENTNKTFLATVTSERSMNNLYVNFSAEPFVFFKNGAGLTALYLGEDLTLAPKTSISGNGNKLQMEEAMIEYSTKEPGYLSCSFMDFQFTGSRTNKIKSFKKLSHVENLVTWQLSVENVDISFDDFYQYEAELTVDTKLGVVELIKIKTKNYTLIMDPVK